MGRALLWLLDCRHELMAWRANTRCQKPSATRFTGQPKVATFTLKGGNKTIDPKNPMGSMQGVDFSSTGSLSKNIPVQDRDIDLKPGWVYWPNRKYGKQVPSGARLLATNSDLTGPSETGIIPACRARAAICSDPLE